ncbi:hypothetical protein F1C76_16025 [Geodermatophilaceae bacterium NBWT11]|nr:hypothetical protein F1C76_16025 [Geodermatophilaceae bacterium NBWT11]
MRSRSFVVLALAAAVSLLAGCTGGDESTAAPAATTTAAAASTGAAAPVTSTSTAASAPVTSGTGCAPVGNGVPADAASAPTLDVDGDGRADTAWLEGNTSTAVVVVGVTTASGATFSADYSSASPVSRQMLIADVDGAGTIAAIVSDGRTASLFSVSVCAMVPALNVQGSQYTFDLTGTGGTGVGCSRVAGEPSTELVGLQLDQDADGQPVSITRTAVLLDGTTATNGASDTIDVAGDPTGPAVASATRISCGDLVSTVHASS